MIYHEPYIGEKFYYQPPGQNVSYAGHDSFCTTMEMVTFCAPVKDNPREAIFAMLDFTQRAIRLDYIFNINNPIKHKRWK